MLSFRPKKVNAELVLENANTLLRFEPNDLLNNNALTIDKDGRIVVSIRPIYVSSSPLRKKSPKKGLLQESMVLLWQAALFWPLMQARFEELKLSPKADVHQYHQHVMNMQGFYHLCKNFYLQFDDFKNQIDDIHSIKGFNQDIDFKLANNDLSLEWDSITLIAKALLKNIRNYRKEMLGVQEGGLAVIDTNGFVVHIQRINLQEFDMGQFTFCDSSYRFLINLDLNYENVHKASKNPLTSKLSMSLYNLEIPSVHGTLCLYPSWEAPAIKSLTTGEFLDSEECSSDKLLKGYEKEGTGMIALIRKPVLNVAFTHFCEPMLEHSFVPYFMGMVATAKRQDFSGITFYAPHSFSAIALSCGFSSQDSEQPTITQQQAIINTAMNEGTNVPLMQQTLDRNNDSNELLLRAFYFNLSELASKPVFISKEKRQTTFEALLRDNPVIDAKKYPQGIIPEMNKAPLAFSPSLKNLSLGSRLAQRERGQRFELPVVSLSKETIDYRTLNSKDGLTTYALADTEVAKEHDFKKQLTLRRR